MNKKKYLFKYIKLFAINLILTLIVLAILEFVCAVLQLAKVNCPRSDFFIQVRAHYTRSNDNFDWYFKKDRFLYERVARGDSCKGQVLVIGCSFAYGALLERQEALYNVLSKYTDTTVYNLGVGGANPKDFLFMLRSPELNNFLLSNKDNIMYVIYPYIKDHRRRLYSSILPFNPEFKIKNGKFKYLRPRFYRKSFLYKEFMEIYWLIINITNKDWELYRLYLNEMSKEINKNFKNGDKKTKLVVLVYEESIKDKWDEIDDENIIVIKLTDLIPNINGAEYRIPVDNHPNAKAWETIVPVIVERLNYFGEVSR